MKKSIISILSLFALCLICLTSCDSRPEYSRMIPDNAGLVWTVNIPKVAENKDAAFYSKLLKKLKWDKVIDYNADTGIDLSDPVTLAMCKTGGKETSVLLGSISDRDDFTQLLNSIAKKDHANKVVDEDEDVSYLIDGNMAVFYNDDFFYAQELPSANRGAVISAIVDKMKDGESKGSMAESDNMKELCSKDGAMQLLLQGGGTPSYLSLGKISIIMDINTEPDKVVVKGECLTDDKAWEKYLDKADDALNKIDDDLQKYVSSDGLALMANIDGGDLYDLIKDFKATKAFDAADLNMLKDIDGNVALSYSNIDTSGKLMSNIPIGEGGLFIESDDNSLARYLAKAGGNSYDSIGVDSYTSPIAFDRKASANGTLSPKAYLNFGFRDDITYIDVNAGKGQLTEAKHKLPMDNAKGKRLYVYFNFKKLRSLTGNKYPFYDYAEGYYEKNGKFTVIIHLL